MPEGVLTASRARLWTVAGCVVALAACPGSKGPPAALAAGDAITGVGVSGSRPALVWVIHAEACLGCYLTDPARSLRALQRQLGDSFETVVVAVSELGAQDRNMVGRFLEAQRISARVEVRHPSEHERDFGAGPIPAFYLLGRESRVHAVLSGPLEDNRRVGRDSLTARELIERLAQNWPTEEPGS